MIVFNNTIELTMKQFNNKRKIAVLSSCSIMVKQLACELEVPVFECHYNHYVIFQTNTLGKVVEPPNSPTYGLNGITAVILHR